MKRSILIELIAGKIPKEPNSDLDTFLLLKLDPNSFETLTLDKDHFGFCETMAITNGNCQIRDCSKAIREAIKRRTCRRRRHSPLSVIPTSPV